MMFCLRVCLGITCMSCLRRSKEESDPLVVELQSLLARGGVVVKWRGGDLGTEPRPSVRAAYEPSLQPLKVFSHFPATSVFLILRSL